MAENSQSVDQSFEACARGGKPPHPLLVLSIQKWLARTWIGEMTRRAKPLPRASFAPATNFKKSPFIKNCLMPRSNAALSAQAARSMSSIPLPGSPVELLMGICGSQRWTSVRRLELFWLVVGVGGQGRRLGDERLWQCESGKVGMVLVPAVWKQLFPLRRVRLRFGKCDASSRLWA